MDQTVIDDVNKTITRGGSALKEDEAFLVGKVEPSRTTYLHPERPTSIPTSIHNPIAGHPVDR